MKQTKKKDKKITKLDLEIEKLQKLEEIEYGIKEFMHGLLIGAVIGFIIAFIVLT